jgi:predicted ATP-grasp superfamily ATP-dependent carboligase
MTITILLTCVGGELAPKMLLDLKLNSRHKIKVIGTDVNPLATGRHFCDVFAVVPSGLDSNYSKVIKELSVKHGVNLVIPTSDEEAVAISSSREIFKSEGIQLACTDHSTLIVLTNKAKTYEKLVEYGVHTPMWSQVNTTNDLKQVVQDMYNQLGEVVVKPVEGRGGRGVYIVTKSISGVKQYKDRREIHVDIKTFFRKFSDTLVDNFPIMVMERLVEPVFDLDLLAWKGESIRVIPRRRINSAVPNEGHIISEDKALIELGEDLIRLFQLSWLYDCDVMYDKKGRPCVLEINPRESGSVAVSIAAGVPLLDDLISLSVQEKVPKIIFPKDVMIIPYKSLSSVNT